MQKQQEHAPQDKQFYPVVFTGEGEEYFKIWIVNLALSILTLGIYSAWAKVRTRKYLYANTILCESSFEYLASPLAILKGRAIAVSIFVAYYLVSDFFVFWGTALALAIVLMMPWVTYQGLRFNARMTRYKNICFSFGGSLKEMYKVLILISHAPTVIFAIIAAMAYYTDSIGGWLVPLLLMSFFVYAFLQPYVKARIMSHYINHYKYANASFGATLRTSEFFGIYARVLYWWVGSFIVGAAVISLALSAIYIPQGSWVEKMQILAQDPSILDWISTIASGVLIGFYLVIFVAITLTKAYLTTATRNYFLNETSIDNRVTLHSNLETKQLFFISFTNMLLTLISFGFAYPFTVIRMQSYMLGTLGISFVGNIDEYTNDLREQSATGEELGEVFGMDMGIFT